MYSRSKKVKELSKDDKYKVINELTKIIDNNKIYSSYIDELFKLSENN